jgi:hypothetical protein
MLPPFSALKANGAEAVLVGLDAGEQHTERDGADQTPLQALAVTIDQRVVRPGHRGARQQQNERVQQRQVPRIEHFDASRRPDALGHLLRAA